MFSNPVTTIFGVLIMLCPLVELIWPELKGVCSMAQSNLIGLGLVSAQDGIKKTFTTMEHKGEKSNKLANLLLWFVAASFLTSGCAQASKLFSSPEMNMIKTELQALGAGTYTATIAKDGKPLVQETWVCVPDEKTQLLACKRQA